MRKILYALILLTVLLSACQKKSSDSPQLHTDDIAKVIFHMTELMIHDVTNPPLAARFYSYATLAGYEVAVQNDTSCFSMKGVLNEYPDIEKPKVEGKYDYTLSAILAMIGTAKKMQPSGFELDHFERQLLDSCKRVGFSEEIIANSKEYAVAITKQILAYAKADRYNRISNYPRYTPLNAEGAWYPTPPGFFPPVEPYFNTVRPFVLDSAAQFKPAPPVPFSKDKNSEFYKMMMSNYIDGGSALTEEQRIVSAFWDCNPFALKNDGHLMVGMKKISPGAHWLGITGIACKQSKLSFAKSLQIHSIVAVGLMDSFMGCWDEKFRSNRIRPETAIRKYIDPNWHPLLQTPPFPEYLSGHSSISSTSATILTHYFGENYAYTDDVEEAYGLPRRSFKSFHEAANEAAISRYYGGIHFMDAIDNGTIQGEKVGEWIISKIKNRQADHRMAKL